MILLSMKDIHCTVCGKDMKERFMIYVPKQFYNAFFDGEPRHFNCCKPCAKEFLNMICLHLSGNEYGTTFDIGE